MILIDSNVPMYLVGAEHPHKLDAQVRLERIIAEGVSLVTDAEVLQEILHRYRALNRWTDGREVYDLARQIFPAVLPITSEILDRARILLDEYDGLMARDALHAAVVEINLLESICSYDHDFDRITTISRTEP